MIPKVTSPLAKAIRTTEGILVVVVNAGLAFCSIKWPSQLPPEWAATLATVNTGLLTVSRTMLKVFGLQKEAVGIEPPDNWEQLDAPPETARKPDPVPVAAAGE